MGFVGEVMDSVQGIHLYYIVGLLIFITLFIVILTRTLLIPKAELVEYKTSILDLDEQSISGSSEQVKNE